MAILKHCKNESGVALMMVIIAFVLMMLIFTELIYTVRLNSQLGINLSDRLQAFYLSKSAARFSLWRLRAYMAAQKEFDKNPNNGIFEQKDVDMIWGIPLPSLPFDTSKLDLTEVQKSTIDEFKKKSKSKGKFYAKIEAEGKKIPLNLLTGMPEWSSDKKIQEVLRKLIITMIDQNYINDENFKDKYPDFKPDDLVDAIIDYIDGNKEPQENQPDEDREYEQLPTPYKSKNLPLYTLEELRMVRLWEDAFFDRFSDLFTVYPNDFYINVNKAEKPMFDALVRMQDKEPNEEDLSNFLEDRSKAPFKSSKDFSDRFKNFFAVDPPKDILYVIKDRTFIIEGFGEAGGSRAKQVLAVRLEARPQRLPNCETIANPTDKQKCEDKNKETKNNPPLDFLRIVYWKEEPV